MLDHLLCFALYGASMAVTRTYKPLLDELGITYPQYIVLVALWDGDGQTIGSIADRLGLDSSTVTPLVKRLEAAKLVRRKRDKNDERRVTVTLTDRGRGMQHESACLGLRLLDHSGMKPTELMALTAEVRRLRDNLVQSQSAGDDDA